MPIVNGNSVNANYSDVFIRDSADLGLIGNTNSPTNVMGRVGTADWGPVGIAQASGGGTASSKLWGPGAASRLGDPHDLVSAANVSFAVAAGLGRSIVDWQVRATDGTETKGTKAMKDITSVTPLTGLTLTAKYHGSASQFISYSVTPGTNPSSFTVTFTGWSGTDQETYSNIPATGFWVALQNAINNGQFQNGGSKFVVASGANGSALAPAQTTAFLSAGTSGRGVDSSDLIGDPTAKTGLYALRGLNPLCAMFHIVGLTDVTVWPTILAFEKANGMQTVLTVPIGTDPAGAVSIKQTAAIDDQNVVIAKDWYRVQDFVNNQQVFIDPAAGYLGAAASIDPSESPGNKPIAGILGTDYTGIYSPDDLALMQANGIVTVTNPIPGFNTWGIRHGQNTSSNPSVKMFAHARMINWVKQSCYQLMGPFVEAKQGTSANDPTRAAIENTLNHFGSTNSNQFDSFSSQCDLNNNSISSIQNGTCYFNVFAGLLGIIVELIGTVQAGVGVTKIEVVTPGGG